MKGKSIAKLTVTLVLIVLFTLLAVFGLRLNRYYSIKPVGQAISLGLDLQGGISAEYMATDSTVENFDSLMDSTVSALRERLTNAGFTEANVSRRGSDRIGVEIPGVENHEEVINIIGTPAHLEFRAPNGDVVVEGKNIKNCAVSYANDAQTLYGVSFELDDEGTKAFAEATQTYLGQAISIYMDDDLISAPIVNSAIPNGQGQITSSSSSSSEESYNWARDLALLIQSGALPLDITEVETRSVSATLGMQAIDGAVLAGLIGLILVILFMIAMYRLPGVAASMALCIYVLIVFYALALTGAQLTLQGIAGILLGIGMAVDANVVIFERFREELKQGRTPANAVKFGFRHAVAAVIDSNVTTLIAAGVLFALGTGSIKGFALTLGISIVASLFTAVLVTRWLLNAICNLGIRGNAAYTR
ncbi:MAG: protein translocase subunit SecD [Clostridia bacterium]|nr:protein translocase subunit SecD [Clostridia bacterium]MBQ8971701.1 protein translocase subunit SecD [Clostridia bacterium]